MDLQNTLTSISRFLLKNICDTLKVIIHNPLASNLFNYTVTFHYQKGELYLSGTGVSKYLVEAFFKSIIELGENIIMFKERFPDRSGIAGGIVEKSIILRAQSELLERDALLFHYQNVIPFLDIAKMKIQNEEVLSFKLETKDPKFTTIFVTNPSCANGESECLLNGIGSHTSELVATRKALEEYSTMRLIHEKYPQWCPNLLSLSKDKISLPDFHHKCSGDDRNKKRIKFLCSPQLSQQSRTLIGEWKVTKLKSPIRFFKYFRVENPDLKKLEFMKQELNLDEAKGPLYHPFW